VAIPAGDSRLDYFTDDANQTSTGGTTPTLPGYGPNTCAIMMFHVANTTPASATPVSAAPVPKADELQAPLPPSAVINAKP
jgi:hypothetical protein